MRPPRFYITRAYPAGNIGAGLRWFAVDMFGKCKTDTCHFENAEDALMFCNWLNENDPGL